MLIVSLVSSFLSGLCHSCDKTYLSIFNPPSLATLASTNKLQVFGRLKIELVIWASEQCEKLRAPIKLREKLQVKS